MQSADTDKVDAVSGATYSSKGIMAAVRDALKKALAKKDTETTVETNNTNNSTNDNNTNTDNSSEDNTCLLYTSSDVYERIMGRLQGKDIRIVVDATKDLLLNVLKYHPFLIKPNNHELGEMFDVVLKTNDEIVEYAKKLQEKGARNVLVSMAGDGEMCIRDST